MKRYHSIATLLLVLVCGLSLLRWEVLVASGTSLGCYLLLTLREGGSPSVHWVPSAAEYWVAFVAWSATVIVLLIAASGRRPRTKKSMPAFFAESKRSSRGSLFVLLLLIFVALCTPLLVPVDPSAQGNLVTTRLLKPMTIGSISTAADGPDGASTSTDSPIEQCYRKANRTILHTVPHLDRPSEGAGLPNGRLTSAFVFLFGTDDAGRDVFSRVLAGTRVSLGIGIAAALAAVLIGGCIGFAASTWGSWVDSLLMRTTDLFLSLPGIIVVVAIIAFVGQSVWSLILVLALTGWMSTARIVRAEVLVLRQREYVAAARLLGVSSVRIMVRHLLPNIRPLLVTAAVLQFGNAVLGEAALSFLGLGIHPPTPSWGNMIGEAVGYTSRGWWVGVFPGLFLSSVLLATHKLGEQ